ncbi:MAG: prepilin peptidase [Gammaproteobacteria bacterium]
MSPFGLLEELPAVFSLLACVLGLMVGSFLNVVIYRLPAMLEKNWRRECNEFLGLTADGHEERFNLLWPPSHCPNCKSKIRFYQNVPVLSYIVLGGKCAECKTPISIRYPFIEMLTGIASAAVAWRFGYSYAALFALLLTWSLIALSAIDIDHQLLPDAITLPMLWLGLFLSLFNVFADAHASIIGAIAGYLCLWTVYQSFKLATGKEGMGYGDFKLLALFGAWLGWQHLPAIVLLSSLVGAILGVAMILLTKRSHRIPIPFGPYLAIAGWTALMWGDKINRFYLDSAGL